MQRSKIHNLILLGTFSTILLFPLFDGFLGILEVNVNNEKRELVKKDNTIGLKSKIKTFLTNYDNDFNGRSFLINLYIKFKSNILETPPLPQKVITGKNDFLFLVNYNSMDDYRNVYPFTDVQLDSILVQLIANQQFMDSLGVKYYVVVTPTKPRIYPEFLPDYVKKVGQVSRLSQLKKQLQMTGTAINFLDLTDTILQSKYLGDLYFKNDSHWNELGAFIGYSKLMQIINRDFPDIPVRKIDEYKKIIGQENDLDLAKVLGKDIGFSEPAIKLKSVILSETVNIPHDYPIPEIKKKNPFYVISTSNKNGRRKLIMYRDSFSGSLTPFMSESFNRGIFIWKYSLDKNFIFREKPDVVVQQIVERHIDLLKN